MDGTMFVLLAALVAVFGVIVGAQVQKTCRFVMPKDFLTLGMIAAIVALLLTMPFDYTRWSAPFLLGYFVGYLVVGRTTYTMCINLTDPNHLDSDYRIFYEDYGKTYVQEQSNRALFDRLVFGIRNEVDSDYPLDDDKVVMYHRPLFPRWTNRAIFIDSLSVTVEDRNGRFLRHRVYTTHVRVAYGSQVSKLQLMYDIKVLEDMQLQIIDLTAQVHRLESETGPKMLEHAMQLDMAAKRTTPENRALSLAKSFAKVSIPEIKKDKKQDETQTEPKKGDDQHE